MEVKKGRKREGEIKVDRVRQTVKAKKRGDKIP